MATTSALSKIKTLAGLMALVGLLVYIGLLARDYLAQQHNSGELLATQSCEPAKGDCVIERGDLRIALQLGDESQPVHSGSRLQAQVSLNNSATETVRLSFQGKEMYMGENHFELSPVDANRFAAEVMLPVCTTGRMTWQAQVSLDNSNSVIFEFDTE